MTMWKVQRNVFLRRVSFQLVKFNKVNQSLSLEIDEKAYNNWNSKHICAPSTEPRKTDKMSWHSSIYLPGLVIHPSPTSFHILQVPEMGELFWIYFTVSAHQQAIFPLLHIDYCVMPTLWATPRLLSFQNR